MNSKILALAFSILLSNVSFGQAFKDLNWHVKSTGANTEAIKEFRSGPNGQFLISGVFSGTDVQIAGVDAKARGSVGNDSYLGLFDSSGTVIWIETFGSSAVLFTDMVVAMDKVGDIYISGAFTSAPGPRVPYKIDFFDTTIAVTPNTHGGVFPFYSKVSNKGSVKWFHRINAPRLLMARALDMDANGNLYIGGPFSYKIKSGDTTFYAFDSSSTSVANDYFLLKVNSKGNHQWLKTFGSREKNDDLAISVSTAGDIYATGTWTGDTMFVGSKSIVNPNPEIGANPNGWHAKFNTNGKEQWLIRHSDKDATVNKIKANPAGGFVASVYSNEPLVLDGKTYGTGYSILRYGNDGVFQSVFHIDGPLAPEFIPGFYAYPGNNFIVQEDGSVTFSLSFEEETVTVDAITIDNSAGDFGTADVIYAKIDGKNEVQWVHHIGGMEVESVGAVAYYNNNIILTGGTSSPKLTVAKNTTLTNSGTLTADFFILSFKNQISSTPEILKKWNLNFYPNPTQDFVQVDLQNFRGNVDYELIDASGKVYDAQRLEGGSVAQLNVSLIPSGIYFVSMRNGLVQHTERLVIK